MSKVHSPPGRLLKTFLDWQVKPDYTSYLIIFHTMSTVRLIDRLLLGC